MESGKFVFVVSACRFKSSLSLYMLTGPTNIINFLTAKANIKYFKIQLVFQTNSGDRIPVGARFSAPVQTGRGSHPASYTMGTVSFQTVKRAGVALTTHPI